MNKNLKLISIFMVLVLCLSFSASAADSKIKTKDQIIKEKIQNKDFVKYQQWHDKTKFDREVAGNLNLRVQSIKNKVPDGFEPAPDGYQTMVSYKHNGKIHIRDTEHKVETIQVPWSEIATLPGFDGSTVLITHFDDFGIKDGVWVQEVYNIDGFCYLEEIPFSEVVVSGFTGTYTKTDNLITPDDTVNLGYTFDSDDVQYLNISVTDQYPTKTNPYDINTTGLVGWWNLDDDYADSSTSGNDGTESATGIHFENVKYNNGTVFNGSSDQITVSPDSNLTFNDLTFGAWFNTSTSGATQTIIRRNGDAVDEGYYLFRIDASTNKAQLQIFDRGATNLSKVLSTSVINIGELTHVVATRNTTDNTLNMYINGEFENTASDITSDPLGSDSANMYIGSGGGSEYFNGSLDEIVMFNEVLSEEEIEQLYYIRTSQLATRTNSNSTYSSLWNSSTDNPISIPFGAGESISSLRFDNSTSIEQGGITIYEPENMLFNISVEVGHTENTTNIYEEVNGDSYQVFIQHIPGVDSVSGIVEFTSDANAILSSPFLTTGMDTNNTNASMEYNVATRVWTVTTGPVVANQTYNYVLYGVLSGSTLENVIEDGFGNDNMEPFTANGNDTVIIGSVFTATTPTDELWGNEANDLWSSTSGLFTIGTIILVISIFVIRLKKVME